MDLVGWYFFIFYIFTFIFNNYLGETPLLTYWEESRPSGQGDCVVYKKFSNIFKWSDLDCSIEKHFICVKGYTMFRRNALKCFLFFFPEVISNISRLTPRISLSPSFSKNITTVIAFPSKFFSDTSSLTTLESTLSHIQSTTENLEKIRKAVSSNNAVIISISLSIFGMFCALLSIVIVLRIIRSRDCLKKNNKYVGESEQNIPGEFSSTKSQNSLNKAPNLQNYSGLILQEDSISQAFMSTDNLENLNTTESDLKIDENTLTVYY